MQLNLLAMARPGKVELDALEELGNPGWNWDNLLGYMKKVGPCFHFSLTLSPHLFHPRFTDIHPLPLICYE